jgi:uncharacterized membrane protein SpoIIM required for sporulation
MKQIPKNEGNIPEFNKKAIRMIVILFILGIITGLLFSYVFINEANQRIENYENRDKPFPKNGDFNPEPLTLSDIIMPSIGVIIVCISTFLLLGLIIVYIKIFLTTSSKYIVGLLFFLIPLFIQSIF